MVPVNKMQARTEIVRPLYKLDNATEHDRQYMYTPLVV